jgi:tRNA-2-methylthio-N6-dimethylallyladenosine synthase
LKPPVDPCAPPRTDGAADRESRGRYWVETWGCQMNVHDSEKLAGALVRDGYRPASTPAEADVVLLNTCAIREKATEKVFSELGRLARWKEGGAERVLGVCGCVGQEVGEGIFRRAPYVDFVIGPRATGALPGILRSIRDGEPGARRRVDTAYRDDSIRFPFEDIRREGEGTGKAFVTIVEGCNHRCTYCIVPQTRGREVCRDMGSIVDEVRALAGRGVLEIEFLGQTVNAYRDRDGNTLACLLLAASEVAGVARIRFTTSHPAQMTDGLMDAMASASPKVCPYLHLPVQSGSSAVLGAMRRGYDRDGYLRKIEGLRRRIPGILFGTDVIVGFPTEAESDLDDTLSLLDEVQYDTVYSFAYSARPGTAAPALGDLPGGIKVERLRRLQAHQRGIQERRNREWVGREVEVLVEGPSKRDPLRATGRTPENKIVHFPGPAEPGRLRSVRIVGSGPWALAGEAASRGPSCPRGFGDRIILAARVGELPGEIGP